MVRIQKTYDRAYDLSSKRLTCHLAGWHTLRHPKQAVKLTWPVTISGSGLGAPTSKNQNSTVWSTTIPGPKFALSWACTGPNPCRVTGGTGRIALFRQRCHFRAPSSKTRQNWSCWECHGALLSQTRWLCLPGIGKLWRSHTHHACVH